MWGRVLLALRNHGHVVSLTDHFIGHHLHLVVHFVEATAHESLDGINGVFGIGDRLPLCHLANQTLAGFGKRDHRRRSPAALLVCDDLGFAAFHHRDHRVGCTQVNADNLRHVAFS